MSKKEYVLIGLALVLGGAYIFFFSGWFQPKFIRVEHSIRSSREAWAGGQQLQPVGKGLGNVTFALHQTYRLTSVRVVRADEIATNKYAHPLWHLVSKEGSSPAEGFAYGFPIPGMAPPVAGALPDPLEPGRDYLLLVEAGSLKGTNQFRLDQQVSVRR